MKKDSYNQTAFGDVLSQAGQQMKITVREICSEAGISSATYSKV